MKSFSQLSAELIAVITIVVPKKVRDINADYVQLDQTDYNQIFWQLFSPQASAERVTQSSTKKASGLLHELNEYIISSQSEHAFSTMKLRNPILVKRPKPPLRQQNLQQLPLLERSDDDFLSLHRSAQHIAAQGETLTNPIMLPKTASLTLAESDIYLGRIIYSAMRFGGLLRIDLLKAFLHALRFEQPFSHQEVIWFEFKGQAGDEHLWLPDPITLLLMNLYYQNKEAITANTVTQELQSSYRQCLQRFLRKYKHTELAGMSIKQFRNLIVARLSLTITPCLLPVLTADEPSLTLTPTSFYRLLGMRKPAPLQDIDIETEPQPKKQLTPIMSFARSSVTFTDCAETMKHAKDLLKKAGDNFTKADVQNRTLNTGHKISGYSLKNTKNDLLEIANDPLRNLLPITRELLRWSAHRLVNQSHWSQKLRPQSLLSLLGTIFSPLTRLFGERRIDLLDSETINEIYLDIIDESPTLAGKTKRARFLRDFHIFLVKEYGLAPSHVFTQTIVKHAKEQAVLVDANILLPQEYQQAIEFLSQQNTEIALAQKVLLILGFRCGLRRSEAYMLRLCDIHHHSNNPKHLISEATELMLRPHQERSLKSTSAVRRIPIGLLATSDELAALQTFLTPRMQRLNSTDYLFVLGDEDAALVDDGALFDSLVKLLQSITGDPTFRYHRLRHSFVTWLFWYWQKDKYTHSFPLQSQLQHPAMAHLANAKKEYFSFDDLAPNRKVLHAISMMTGHSGPSITTLHYLHSMYWLGVAEFWRDSHFSRETEIELLGVHRRKVFRHLQQQTISGLVSPQLEAHCQQIPKITTAELPTDLVHQQMYGRTEERIYTALYEYQNGTMEPDDIAKLAKQYQVDCERLTAAINALQTVANLKIQRRNKANDTGYIDGTINKPINRRVARLPSWPVHHSAAKTTMRILEIFPNLAPEEQLQVLDAATHIVWKCPAKLSDIRFFYQKRMWTFIDNITPLARQLLPEQKLKLSMRLNADVDSECRQHLLNEWQITEEKCAPLSIMHRQYLFIGERIYVSVNMTATKKNQPTSQPIRNADYGFKFALIALYFLHCRTNPHIQQFIDNKGKAQNKLKHQKVSPPTDAPLKEHLSEAELEEQMLLELMTPLEQKSKPKKTKDPLDIALLANAESLENPSAEDLSYLMPVGFLAHTAPKAKHSNSTQATDLPSIKNNLADDDRRLLPVDYQIPTKKAQKQRASKKSQEEKGTSKPKSSRKKSAVNEVDATELALADNSEEIFLGEIKGADELLISNSDLGVDETKEGE